MGRKRRVDALRSKACAYNHKTTKATFLISFITCQYNLIQIIKQLTFAYHEKL